ncbi:MAG TPA: outer membrane beta-barrel protein [Thermoanaerobaculia bacterium]|nr:outer membrane beta-barrel protein [Thermoanaerobaculia bacterium]
MRRCLFAFLLLIPGAAFAQGAGFEITPTAGYRFSGSVTSYDDYGYRQSRDLKVEEGGAYGVTFDVPIGYRWQLELLANHQGTSFRSDRGLFTPDVNLGDVNIDYYQIGVLYNWGRGQVNPYIAASVGIAHVEPKFSALASDDRFAGSLAGGVKIFFNRNVGLRLEARGYWANIDTGINTAGHHSGNSNEALYQGEGSGGIILAW